MHTFQNIRGREGGGADQDSERQLSINPCTKYRFIGSLASEWAWGGLSPYPPSWCDENWFSARDLGWGQTRWNNKLNRAWVTESEEGRVYPNRKHLGLIQSNEKYNSFFFFFFFFLKVGRRPILFICQLSMIANATWFESIQTWTTCKNWKHCHGLACTTGSAMWSESHMFEMDCICC